MAYIFLVDHRLGKVFTVTGHRIGLHTCIRDRHISSLSPTAAEMVQPSLCFWAFLLPIVGPSLALIYGVSVAIFLAFWHESIVESKAKSMLMRSALLVAAVATSIGLCEANAPLLEAILPISLVFVLVSAWLLRQTRLHDVEGPTPTFSSNCMKGKVVLITGANAGIGRETVRQLASLGATVILACRSESRAQEAMEDVQSSLKTEASPLKSPGQLRFLKLDLSDLDSVRSAASTFLEMDLPLHVLINNAGVMMGQKKTTKDGIELTMQANHFGHFLLTMLLLPKLQDTEGSRMLSVTSSTYALASNGFDFDDPFCDKARKYTLFGQYGHTKLANILFCKEFVRRYPDIASYAIHPGIVRTEVVRNMPWLMRCLNSTFALIVAAFQKVPPQGAYTSVLCACGAEDDLPPSGSYLQNCAGVATNAHATCEEVRNTMGCACLGLYAVVVNSHFL